MTKRISARELPTIIPCTDDYARLVAQNWDTVQEAFRHTPTPHFCDRLDQWQRAAADIGDSLEGRHLVDLNGRPFLMCATGARGGFKYRLESDDILIFIGSPKREWTISVRYLSAGLWEHGLGPLRQRALDALKDLAFVPKSPLYADDDFIRVSRADWAFDFYSPQFTHEYRNEIAANVIARSAVKSSEHFDLDQGVQIWRTATQGQGLTIGSKTGLQLQLYNKTKEIDDKSGKTWMYLIWVEGLDGEWPWGARPKDVWRLEVRLSGNFLKDRDIRRPAQLDAHLPELITEALCNRRLTVPNPHDEDRSRWPLHPLWERALREFSRDKIRPIGRTVTGRRDALVDNAVGQLAGQLRNATVLNLKDYSPAGRDVLIRQALRRLDEDPDHAKKIIAAQARYSTVDEAR